MKMVEPSRQRAAQDLHRQALYTEHIPVDPPPQEQDGVSSVWPAKRTQATKGGDIPDSTRYFALVSRQVNSSPVVEHETGSPKPAPPLLALSGAGSTVVPD